MRPLKEGVENEVNEADVKWEKVSHIITELLPELK